MDLQLNVRELPEGVIVVEVNGDVELCNCGTLKEELIRQIKGGATRLIVNLDQNTYIDSTGLGVLVGGLKRMKEREGRYALVFDSPRLSKLFRVTGLVKVFRLFSSEADAVDWVTSQEVGGE